MSENELNEIKEKIMPYTQAALLEKGLDMMFIMLTNIIEESTELLCIGANAKNVIKEAFDLPKDTEDVILDGVVSRKKQLIPAIVVSLQN